MKILIISGFLGAGKTTFIAELARRTGQQFVVMENEYGEVGIDGSRLGAEQPQMNIWEMTEGCVCCSVKADFSASILTIANTLDPECLVVEPTGVGLLGNVISNIRQIEYQRISLLSPITILDGYAFDHCVEEYADIYQDQIRAAGTILFSKLDRGDPEQVRRLEGAVRELNPGADLHTEHYTALPDSWWQELLRRPLTGELLPEAEKAVGVELDTIGLRGVRLPSGNHLLLLLSGVVSGVFGNICRAKGWVEAGDVPLRFDVVDGRYSVTGMEPGESDESVAVFIGANLDSRALKQALRPDCRPRLSRQKKRGPGGRRLSRESRSAAWELSPEELPEELRACLT